MSCRIVLRDDVEAIARDLAQTIGASTLTELVSLMVYRYGDHLRQTWRVQPITTPTAPETLKPVPTTTANFDFDQPITGF